NGGGQSGTVGPVGRTHGSRLPTMPRGEPQAGGDYTRPAARGIKKKTPPPSGGSASEARADRESFVGLAWQRRGTYEGEWEEHGGGSLRLVRAPFACCVHVAACAFSATIGWSILDRRSTQA